jgi:hypothetical protein
MTPLNQFGRMRTYVDPDFKDCVRISVNPLWAFSFIDLEREPFVYSQPDTHGRYIVMQALNMWTDDFASVGRCSAGLLRPGGGSRAALPGKRIRSIRGDGSAFSALPPEHNSLLGALLGNLSA